MPEARLERTRNPKPTVPPCVRLDHEWRWYAETDTWECIRCRVRPVLMDAALFVDKVRFYGVMSSLPT